MSTLSAAQRAHDAEIIAHATSPYKPGQSPVRRSPLKNNELERELAEKEEMINQLKAQLASGQKWDRVPSPQRTQPVQEPRSSLAGRDEDYEPQVEKLQ